MISEDMLVACRKGILLPAVGDAAPVTFYPDSLEWDAGILAGKANRKLFIYVVEAMEGEEWIAEMSQSFKEATMPAILVAARTPEELVSTGLRIWLYNPRIHGVPSLPNPVIAAPVTTLPVQPPPTVPVEPPPPVAPPALVEPILQSAPVHQPESARAEDAEMLSARTAWADLGKEANTWNTAELSRVRIMDGEGLEDVARRVLGEAVGMAWMDFSLMLLKGRTPREASKAQDSLAECLSILRKVSLVQI